MKPMNDASASTGPNLPPVHDDGTAAADGVFRGTAPAGKRRRGLTGAAATIRL
jgi:hypothetical protein